MFQLLFHYIGDGAMEPIRSKGKGSHVALTLKSQSSSSVRMHTSTVSGAQLVWLDKTYGSMHILMWINVCILSVPTISLSGMSHWPFADGQTG